MIKIHLNKTLALIGALALAASISACNKNVAVIGGADGPTNVIVSGAEKNADGTYTVTGSGPVVLRA